MSSLKIVIVVPAYNEAKNIGRVISDLFLHGFRPIDEKGFRQIIVVDDGSCDDTVRKAISNGVTVLRHEINRGQGAALQTGNEYALSGEADAVVHFDGDGQFNTADIKGALEAMEKNGADAVLGSRFLDNRSKIPWSKRHFILPIGRLINRILTGVKLSDAHNGFRVLSRRALEKISITEDGMAHNTEIVKQLKKHGLKFVEYPVEVRYNEYGQGLRGGISIVWDIIKSKVTNL